MTQRKPSPIRQGLELSNPSKRMRELAGGQLGLLTERPNRREISPGAFVEYDPRWLADPFRDRLLDHCLNDLAWSHREFREGTMMPRLEAIYGEPGMEYHYSGLRYRTIPWTIPLRELASYVIHRTGHPYSAVFANQYRDNRDSIGWHADFERNLGPRWPDDIAIASLSLGATRRFRLRPKAGGNVVADPVEYELGHGDLLLMTGAVQMDWEHQVPKESHARGPRVNLTLRVLS